VTRTPTIHYLRENAQERTPHRVLVLDTETLPASDADRGRQVLRLWAAQLVRRHGRDPRRPRSETFEGRTAIDLARTISGLARSDATLWVFAHNLGFDLAVTDLPVHLVACGWTMTEGALTTDSPWMRMRYGSRRLTLADSWSWMPAGVAEIGKLIGLPKLDLPDWQDEDADWMARCRRDVEITAKALVQLLDWWDAGRYGNWSVTGPATGWSSYRHRKPRPHVLIDPDPDLRAFEMRAVTGGRRQAFRVGPQPAGLYADVDLATAHLTAMSERTLPFRRLRRFASLELDANQLTSPSRDLLAEVEIETTVPRYPWQSGRGVFYPVGRFRTVLAGPEIREASRRGELRAIGPGMVYGMSEHMAAWARWLATVLDEKTRGVPKVARLAAKAWSRNVPGKWAGHTSEILDRRPDPRPGWSVESGFLSAGRRKADYLLLGGERLTIARDLWADDAFPAVLAWVQSYTRVALGRLADHLGPAVLSLNTDGLMLDVPAALRAAGWDPEAEPMAATRQLQTLDQLLDVWARDLDPFVARVKRAVGSLTIISPQHLLLDRERRLSGIPRKAVRLARGRYRFEQWPRLRVQLARPLVRGYSVVTVERSLEHIAPAGWLYTDGRVEPVVLYLDAAGGTRIMPPAVYAHLPAELAPTDRQHPALQRTLRSYPQWAPGADASGRPVRPLAAAGV